MPEDFDLLVHLMESFDCVLLTPNVVTECDDLLDRVSCAKDARAVLTTLLRAEENVEEKFVPSAVTSIRQEFEYLGVADCSLLELVDESVVLVTMDAKLALAAQKINPGCINFNHARNYT